MFFSVFISKVSNVVDWFASGTDGYTWESAGNLIGTARPYAKRMAQPMRGRRKGFENHPSHPNPISHGVGSSWPNLWALEDAPRGHECAPTIEHGRKAPAALEGRTEEV